MKWIDAARARIRLIIAPRGAESRMVEEFDLHIDLETDRLIREAGLARGEARRQALAAFGGVEHHKEALRDGRGLAWLGSFALDLRLGVRLLRKYPGLTVVSTLALAIGIALVAGLHASTDFFVRPSLSVPEEERLVALWNHDTGTADPGRQTLGDLRAWRDSLASVGEMGAFARYQRVVSVPGGPTRIARLAEISPGAFPMLRAAPLYGRTLLDDDTRPGSPPVALVGFDLWQAIFGGDPGAVGRTIRIGAAEYLVVGVMPEDFAFPVREQLWTPLEVPSPGLRPGEGPDIDFSFGRLADGATLREAEAELQVIGARLSADYPQTHARLRPRVTTYARSFFEANEPGLELMMRAARGAIGLVLLIVAVNVGTLVYARNAARVGEVAVRTALGASRSRIAFQMFAEALALASFAAVLGVAIMWWPVDRLGTLFRTEGAEGGIPYWFRIDIGVDTALLVAALVMGSALVTGVLPALKLTGGRGRAGLGRFGERTAGLKFGKGATVVVVTQVALTVAVLTVGGAQVRSVIGDWQTFAGDGLSRGEYLVADLRWDLMPSETSFSQVPGETSRRAATRRDLAERLSREPGVRGVTLSQFRGVMPFSVPGAGAPDDAPALRWTYVHAVEPNYFELLDQPVLAGRGFGTGDLDPEAPRVALVNEEFLRRHLPTGQPLGRQVRPVDPRTGQPAGEVLEIVGVAGDRLQFDISQQGPGWRPFPTVYVPLPDSADGVGMLVRVGTDASQLAGRARSIAAEIDPTLVLYRAESLAERASEGELFFLLYAFSVGIFIFAVVLMSAAGTYAMMSFTVSQRTREIGIRVALGAPPRRIVGAVFSRSIGQLGVGTLTGLGLGYLAADGPVALSGGLFAEGPGTIIGVAVLIVVIGLIACGKPVRRALRIEPTEALRADG